MADHEEKDHGSGEGHGGGGHGHGGGGGHGAHGGGGHEEHEGAPEWLISFADNVALMMGFFVILLAMNMKEPTTGGIGGKEKNPVPGNTPAMLDAVISLREAFHSKVSPTSTDPKDAVLVRRLKQREKPGDVSSTGPEGNKQNVQSQRPSDYESPCAVIPFDDGSAEISADAREHLTDAAAQLVGQRYVVDVRGNVSAAEAAMTPDRGMELSFKRSLAVARVLEENGLKWRQLRIVAGGDSYRLTPRAADRAGHRSNQRTELYQTSDLMPDDPYSPTANAER